VTRNTAYGDRTAGNPDPTATGTASQVARRPFTPPGRVELPERSDGRYELGELHGQGGLGRVLIAYDKDLERPVAVKELLHPSARAEARFVREAKLTARLEHPAIVPVHDAGRWPTGEAFYTMKLVAGRSMKGVLGEKQSLEERLNLLPNLLAVADAIAYSHSRGIVHRDLKPANVIIGEYGETVVIDWGLAKDLSGPDDDCEPAAGPYRTANVDLVTVAGEVLGTPAYMSPEQARGEAVSAATDVYALGAMLYELIGGRRPYSHLKDSSAILMSAREERPAPLMSIVGRDAPRDLIAVAEKAMAPHASDRYSDASSFAEDLRRYLTGNLVGAQTYTLPVLLLRAVRRHKAMALAAAFALFVGGWSVLRVITERDEARRARAATDLAQSELILTHAQSLLEQDPTASLAWLKTYEGSDWRRVRNIAADAVSRGVSQHVLRSHSGAVLALHALPRKGAAISFGRDGQLLRWDVLRGEVEVVASKLRAEVAALSVAPDGDSAIMGLGDGSVVLVNLDSGAVARVQGHDGTVFDVAFSATASDLVSAGTDGFVRIWDPSSLEPKQSWQLGNPVGRARFLSDGKSIVACTTSGELLIFARAGNSAGRAGRGECDVAREFGLSLAVSHAGDTFAVPQSEGSIAIWDSDAVAPRLVLRAHEDTISHLEFSPDDRLLLSAGFDGALRVWEVSSGASVFAYRQRERLHLARFSSDGSRILSGGQQGSVRIHAISTGTTWGLNGHSSSILALDFASHSTVLSADRGGTVRVWTLPIAPQASIHGQGHRDTVSDLTYSARSQLLASSGRDATVRLWDMRRGTSRVLGRHTDVVYALDFSPDGSELLSVGGDGAIRIWGTAVGGTKEVLQLGAALSHGRYSPDGKRIAAVDHAGYLHLWAPGSDDVVRVQANSMRAIGVAFNEDGSRVAVAGEDGTVSIHEAMHGALQSRLRGHRQRVLPVFYVERSTELISAAWGGDVRRWQIATGKSEVLYRHSGIIRDLAVALDGSAVVSSGEDGRVLVMHPRLPAGFTEWDGHGAAVLSVAVSPRAELFAAGGDETAVRLLDPATCQLLVLRAHSAPVHQLEFLASNERMVSADSNGRIYEWRIAMKGAAGCSEGGLRSWIESKTSYRIRSTGKEENHRIRPTAPI
jgi:eukaryotic-like serine/threonine-protein kinase